MGVIDRDRGHLLQSALWMGTSSFNESAHEQCESEPPESEGLNKYSQ